MKKPVVSVIVVVYNEETYIGKCIESILRQSFGDFELIVVDAASTDRTQEIVRGFGDKRIRYFRLSERVNIAKSRNFGIGASRGGYVFFTDGDCSPARGWIKEGVRCLKEQGVVGCEGRTVYVSSRYRPGLMENVVYNNGGGFFPTNNVAYKRAVFDEAGFFDESLDVAEDTDMGTRASRLGEIVFVNEMLVIHEKKTLSMGSFFRRVYVTDSVVRMVKRHGRCRVRGPRGIPFYNIGRVVFPFYYFVMFFPPLLIIVLMFRKIKMGSLKDFLMIPLYYVRVVFFRFFVWKTAIKERSFFI